MGFPGGLAVKTLPDNAGDRETQVQSLGGEDPLEEEAATTPVFLLGNLMNRVAWQVTAHGVSKQSTKASQTVAKAQPRAPVTSGSI